MLTIEVDAPAMTIGEDDPLTKLYRFAVETEMPQHGQFFVLRNGNGEMYLMQRLPMSVPDPVLSCVKPDLANIREALEWVDG